MDHVNLMLSSIYLAFNQVEPIEITGLTALHNEISNTRAIYNFIKNSQHIKA